MQSLHQTGPSALLHGWRFLKKNFRLSDSFVSMQIAENISLLHGWLFIEFWEQWAWAIIIFLEIKLVYLMDLHWWLIKIWIRGISKKSAKVKKKDGWMTEWYYDNVKWTWTVQDRIDRRRGAGRRVEGGGPPNPKFLSFSFFFPASDASRQGIFFSYPSKFSFLHSSRCKRRCQWRGVADEFSNGCARTTPPPAPTASASSSPSPACLLHHIDQSESKSKSKTFN